MDLFIVSRIFNTAQSLRMPLTQELRGLCGYFAPCQLHMILSRYSQWINQNVCVIALRLEDLQCLENTRACSKNGSPKRECSPVAQKRVRNGLVQI